MSFCGSLYTVADVFGGVANAVDDVAGCIAHTAGYVLGGIPGIPDGFGEMRRILEEILPPHVGVRYDFWYLTWRELEGKYASWARLEAVGMDWKALEKDVS